MAHVEIEISDIAFDRLATGRYELFPRAARFFPRGGVDFRWTTDREATT
jgi:hypothetical protein